MASVLSGVLLSHGFRREPSAVKSKIADLQKSFGVYSDWLHQTGAGIEKDLAANLKADNDKPAFMLGISDLEMTKLSKCRYYAELECILGSRATSTPIVHVSTIENYSARHSIAATLYLTQKFHQSYIAPRNDREMHIPDWRNSLSFKYPANHGGVS
ncbi:hypothetical protein LEN26_017926 [Aphanomyces euteiches]|nr:hypothetical protein LEN26_017926 [Aphanomyces euteiches]